MEFLYIQLLQINFILDTGVATDTHRLSSSSIPVQDIKNLKSFILPKKTVFQLSNLLQENDQRCFYICW